MFPYDKWSDKELPQFQEGEAFVPSECRLDEGQTSKPKLLTEADLVNLMDEHGIGNWSCHILQVSRADVGAVTGTDATIAQHIQTVVDRKYVHEKMQGSTKYLIPSTLGIGLVEGYDAIGFEQSLSKSELRREVRQLTTSCPPVLLISFVSHRLSGEWLRFAKARRARTRSLRKALSATRKCS